MKKIILFAAMGVVLFSFSSCKKTVDVWNSATEEYAGRYVIEGKNADMSKTLWGYDGSEARIYNTAENEKNQIWIQFSKKGQFNLKGEFNLSGDKKSFKSASLDYIALGNNIPVTETLPTPAPTAAGQTKVVTKANAKCAVLEGKILDAAGTSLGGNKSDSIYLKLQFFGGKITYKSYELPKELRTVPNKAEYVWKFDSSIVDITSTSTYVLSGYRYTGYPEDRF